MTFKLTKRNLAAAIVEIKQAKSVIEAIVMQGRILPLEEEIHELQEMARILGNDIATIESNLSDFGRVGFNGARFAVTEKLK